MHILIESTIKTLQKSRIILSTLSNQNFDDKSIPPYNSSVGSHIRHILDFYFCILDHEKSDYIDLTNRTRSKEVEMCCSSATKYLDAIVFKLLELEDNIIEKEIFVIDDLGMGKTKIAYTYASLLAQANSHTLHHYAIIAYILNGLEICLEDDSFGYNPTTPKKFANS